MKTKEFKVQLYDAMDRLLEEIKVDAKGKKTAIKMAKFKTQIGDGFWILAIE